MLLTRVLPSSSALRPCALAFESIVSRGLRTLEKKREIREVLPVNRKKSLQLLEPELAIVRHPFPLSSQLSDEANTSSNTITGSSTTKDKFVVFELMGTQYKVSLDDTIVINKLHDVDIGKIVEVSQVLVIGSRNATLVGIPRVAGAKVHLQVEEMTKDKKLIVFKHRRRKNSRTKTGFRREITVLRVKDLLLPADKEALL